MNPCKFKSVCINCIMADMEDRPDVCVKLKCEEYTPCLECSKNRNLNGDGLCKYCESAKNKFTLKRSEIQEEFNVEQNKKNNGKKNNNLNDFSISKPGVPPEVLTEEQKEYYLERWDDYKGYYRNPAAYFICHSIILEEINLSYLKNKEMTSVSDNRFAYSKLKNDAIRTLKNLKEQLPEKEASELTDDEKSIAYIYDEYIKEKSSRKKFGVHRILSDEAIALAPELKFTIDPIEILKKCGYSVKTAEEVASKYISSVDIENLDADEILEFFGFKLKEKYAMPYEITEENEMAVSEDSIIEDEQ